MGSPAPSSYEDTWFCGDDIAIWANGEMREFKALDSWTRGSCVEREDGCIPIGADIPEYFYFGDEGIGDRGTISTEVLMVNKSEAKRRMDIEQ